MQTDQDEYDVAIAGAGLAGASLALRLARRGAKVALLDPGVFPRDKLCGEYLSPESWDVLDRMGLSDDLSRSSYQPIRHVRITTPRGRAIVAEVAKPDERPGIGLSRSVLDSLIVRRAREVGADVFERSRVGGPVIREGRVAGLHARHPTDGEFAIIAKVTVAADGRHSSLVKQTGASKTRSRFRPALFGLKRHLIITDEEVAEPPGTVGLHVFPGGYGGTCLVEGGLTNLCAVLPESVVRERRGDLDRVAREALGRNPHLARMWEAGVPSGEWKTVAGVRVEVSTPRIDGILYAGDCQGTVDPLGGQGMTMALLGVEQLAIFVERALLSGSCVDRSLQEACQSAWHKRFDRRIWLCRLFHHTLINASIIDMASLAGRLAPGILSACYRQTRDPAWMVGSTGFHEE